MSNKACAYCGAAADTSDHVVPKCLYKGVPNMAQVPRITVPSCRECNDEFSEDEPQFRDILSIAGDPNPAVNSLWEGPIPRSFKEKDGRARLAALFEQMVPVVVNGEERHMVYPAKDERVMRIIRKVVRGLAYHHGVASAVPDRYVWADVLKYEIPPTVQDHLTAGNAGEGVLKYQFGAIGTDGISSAWHLTFFERTPFIGLILESPDASRIDEASAGDVP